MPKPSFTLQRGYSSDTAMTARCAACGIVAEWYDEPLIRIFGWQMVFNSVKNG